MTHEGDGGLLCPYGLQTEQRHEPLGLGEPQPRLSWRLRCERRGAAQGAYRVTASGHLADSTILTGCCGTAAGGCRARRCWWRGTGGAEQGTARGHVACGWSLVEGRITVTVTVPPGCTAVLEIATADPGGVLEAGALAATRPGVLGAEPSAEGTTLRLASGRYRVSAVAPDTESTIPSTIAPVPLGRHHDHTPMAGPGRRDFGRHITGRV